MRYSIAEIAAIKGIRSGIPYKQVDKITTHLGDKSREDFIPTDKAVGTHTLVILNGNQIPICNKKLQASGVCFNSFLLKSTLRMVYFGEIALMYSALVDNLNSLYAQVEKHGEDYNAFVRIVEKDSYFTIYPAEKDTQWVYCGDMEEIGEERTFQTLNEFGVVRSKLMLRDWLSEVGILSQDNSTIDASALKLAVINVNGI